MAIMEGDLVEFNLTGETGVVKQVHDTFYQVHWLGDSETTNVPKDKVTMVSRKSAAKEAETNG